MNANEIFHSAVNQCNVIENSLEGCLQVLQKICVQKPNKSTDGDCTSSLNLCGKPSYVICTGNRVNGQLNVAPEIIKDEEPAPTISHLFDHCHQKLQSIMDRQRHIAQLVDSVDQKLLINQKAEQDKNETSESEEYEDCKTHLEAPCERNGTSQKM